MNKALLHRAVFAMALVCAFSALARAQSTPPDIDKNWNLISTPCDVSLDELKQKLGNDEILVYQWNGSGYDAVDAMERGRGYILNDNAILNSSVVCKNETPLPQGFAITLQPGWNLIGNPYHRAITFENAFGASAGQFDKIYEFQGNRLREIDKTDHMKPFRGYWVYAKSEVTLTYGAEEPAPCTGLRLLRTAQEGDSVMLGETLELRAVCGGMVTPETEVTEAAEWVVSDASVLMPTDTNGAYTAATPGTAEITVNYNGETTALSFTVIDPNPPITLTLYASDTDLSPGETAALKADVTYLLGDVKTVTDLAAFELSREDVGTVSEAVFTAEAPGSVDITAAYAGLTSEPVTINVHSAEKLQQLVLEVNQTTLEIHQTANLVLKGIYNTGRMEILTDKAAWLQEPADIALIEQSGRFYPRNLGTATVRAQVDGLTSNAVNIAIIAKNLRWLGISPQFGVDALPCPTNRKYKWCYTHHTMVKGSYGQLKAYGEFTNDNVMWIDSVKWETADANILTVDNSGTLKAKSEGLGAVRAYKDGVYSEWIWVYVTTDATREFLIIEYSNEEVIVEKGKSINIGATYYKRDYWGFVSENVTLTAAWTVANPAAGSFADGKFTGLAAGDTGVFAKYKGLTSNTVTLRVWEPSRLAFCDPENPNDVSWNDGLSIASLETDCAEYESGDDVNVCFNAELSNDTQRRALDVCLDLYIYDKDQKLVRTFQNRSCSPTPLYRLHEGYHPVYQYCAEWDRTSDDGATLPPGTYTAVARFYILYCPVLKVNFTIK